MAARTGRFPDLTQRMRSAAGTARREAAGLPDLVAYRLSGGRVVRSRELYRAQIPWQQFTLGRLPGMTSLTERAYFYWHARELFTGAGTIVDLGSWFGSTTASLAHGLARNRRPQARHSTIHAYERFEWEPWMDDFADRARRGPYRHGESFRPEFDLVTARWRARIEVHAGDLFAQPRPGAPIEVLLVDAMKSWPLAQHIATTFYTGLIPGRSAIIHQDFSHCYTPWIHLISYRLRDAFVSAHDVPESETHVLGMVGELPARDELALSRESFDDEEVTRAFEHSLSITPRAKHSGIHAARVMLAIYDGDHDGARERLARLSRRAELSAMHANALAFELEQHDA